MTDIEKEVGDFISADKDNPISVQLDADITPEDAERLHRLMAAHSSPIYPAPAENTITIPVASYAALLRTQAEHDILRAAYHDGVDSWKLEDLCGYVFGKKPKGARNDA